MDKNNNPMARKELLKTITTTYIKEERRKPIINNESMYRHSVTSIQANKICIEITN